MRVLIDGMNLGLGRGTGVATYACNLARCINRREAQLSVLYGRNIDQQQDSLLREIMFADTWERPAGTAQYVRRLLTSLSAQRPEAIPDTGLVERASERGPPPEADEILNAPNVYFQAAAKFRWFGRFLEIRPPRKVDIAHWTYPLPIRVAGARNIYTIHDLVPIKLPYLTLDRKARHLKLLRRIAAEADMIVTVSETSRADIVATLGCAPEHVANTYQSVNIPDGLLARPVADLAADLAHLPARAASSATLSPNGYYLFVGAIEPKKNLLRTVEAYLASGVAEPLVVVGRPGWSCERELALLKTIPRIIHLDYLPFETVIALMRCARGLLFPSLYEGFGLPVLEAFVCGTPVITSNLGATREIAADGAILVDPHDVASIRDAFRSLSGSDSEQIRANLIARGKTRAAAFSEDVVLARLGALYAGLLKPAGAGRAKLSIGGDGAISNA